MINFTDRNLTILPTLTFSVLQPDRALAPFPHYFGSWRTFLRQVRQILHFAPWNCTQCFTIFTFSGGETLKPPVVSIYKLTIHQWSLLFTDICIYIGPLKGYFVIRDIDPKSMLIHNIGVEFAILIRWNCDMWYWQSRNCDIWYWIQILIFETPSLETIWEEYWIKNSGLSALIN